MNKTVKSLQDLGTLDLTGSSKPVADEATATETAEMVPEVVAVENTSLEISLSAPVVAVVSKTMTAAELIRMFRESQSAAGQTSSVSIDAEASPEDAVAFVEDVDGKIAGLKDKMEPLLYQQKRGLKNGDRGYIDPAAVSAAIQSIKEEITLLQEQKVIVQAGQKDFVLYQAKRNMQADRVQEVRAEMARVDFNDPKANVADIKSVCDFAVTVQLLRSASAGPISLKIREDKGFSPDGVRMHEDRWFFYEPAGFGQDARDLFTDLKGFVDEFFAIRKARWEEKERALAPFTVSTHRENGQLSELDRIKDDPSTARNLVRFLEDQRYKRCLFPIVYPDGKFVGEGLMERNGTRLTVSKGTKDVPRLLASWGEKRYRVLVVINKKVDLPESELESSEKVNLYFDLSRVSPAMLQTNIREKLAGDVNFLIRGKVKGILEDTTRIADIRTMSELAGGSVGTTPLSFEWVETDDQGAYDTHPVFHIISDGEKFHISASIPGLFSGDAPMPWLEPFCKPNPIAELKSPKWRAVAEKNGFFERSWVVARQTQKLGAKSLTKDTLSLVEDASSELDGSFTSVYELYERRPSKDGGKTADDGVFIPLAYVATRTGQKIQVTWAMQGRSEKEVGDEIRQDFDIANLPERVRIILIKARAKVLGLKGKEAFSNLPPHLSGEKSTTPTPPAPVAEQKIEVPDTTKTDDETTKIEKPKRGSRRKQGETAKA